jgi:hypothetical protein
LQLALKFRPTFALSFVISASLAMQQSVQARILSGQGLLVAVSSAASTAPAAPSSVRPIAARPSDSATPAAASADQDASTPWLPAGDAAAKAVTPAGQPGGSITSPSGDAAAQAVTPAGQTAAAPTNPSAGQTSTAPETPAAAAPEPSVPAYVQRISKWENEFFSHKYTDESPDKRVGRLEQLIFGAVQTGSTEDRVEKLRSALHQPQSENPGVPSGVSEYTNGTATAPVRKPVTPPAPALDGATAVVPVAGYVSTKTPDRLNPSWSVDQNPVRGPELTVNKKTFTTVLDPQRIIQNLNGAIRDNPKDAELVFQRGKAYLQLDNLNRALADLSEAIAFQPNRSDFYLARAWVYHLMDNSVLSDLDLKQAQFVDPKFPTKIEWGK